MKNNLFKKFLALFLTGTMLGAVGCKDYDDDINDLKGQIDDLKGKIELKADASALSSLQQKLDGINFDDFVKNADLGDFVKKSELDNLVKQHGYQTADDVKALIPKGMSEGDIKNIFDAQIKALDTWGEISTNIGKAVKEYLTGSEYTTAQQTQIVNTILKQLTDDPEVKEIKTAIKNLLGAEFGGYMKDYMTKDDFIGSLDEAAAKALLLENSKLAAGIAGMISSEGFLEQAGLQEKFNSYDSAIKSLRSDVDALIALIQSLVYVPEATDGLTKMAVYKVGDEELKNGIATLTYRVTPAKALDAVAAIYAKNPACLSMVSEKVITRAAAEPASAPVAITDFQAGENGKFTVTIAADKETMNALADNHKSIALALSIKSLTQAPAEPAEGEEEPVVSGVTNDVLSDFAGILYDKAAQSVAFGLFKDDKPYTDETIKVPFDTSVAASKKTLLDGVELKASFDGENYMSLADASEFAGESISVSKYESTVAYSDKSGDVTGDAIKTFIIKAGADKLVWDTTLATAEFSKEAKAENVGSKAVFAHKLTMAVNGKATSAIATNNTTYEIVNQQGATLTFKAQNLPWSYAFVSKNGTDKETPAIDAEAFGVKGEIAIDVTGNLNGVAIGDILAETPVMKVTDAKDADVTGSVEFTFEPLVSQIAKGTKVSVAEGKYAWGNTYTVEYVYTHKNIDYTLTGTITFGELPKNIKVEVSNTAGYANATKTVSWADLFKQVPAGFFKDATEFAGAVTTNSKDAAATNVRYANADDKVGTPISQAATAGTYIEVDAAKGVVSQIVKADITGNGNKFVQTYERTAWYGQKVTVVVTTLIELPTYTLEPNTLFVTNNEVELAGHLTAANVWDWDNATLPAYYTLNAPENAAAASIEYSIVSKNGYKEDGTTKDAGAIYATLDGTSLDWSNANRDFVLVKATAKITGTALVVAEQTYKVRIQQPIKSLAQSKGLEKTYAPNVKTEINLFENLQLTDASTKTWIDAKKLEAIKAGSNTAKEVFSATTGTATSAGIEFKIKSAKNADDTETRLDLLQVSDNKLTYQNNSAVLQQSFTVTLTATFTHQYGTVSQEITVTVKP